MNHSFLDCAHVPKIHIDIRQHLKCFERFTATYLDGPHRVMLDLKRHHSLCVLEQSAALAHMEGFTGDISRSALLAALYHDVGRFPQMIRWQTFSDAISENHGYLGVRVVKREKMLDNESDRVRQMVLTAIALHNRYVLPVRLADPFLTVVRIVRDADKLDIMRIMAEHLAGLAPSDEVVLHVRNEPDKWSPQVAAMVLQGKVPGYKDLVYVNDFRILLGSWMEDLHFASAKRQMAKSGHVQTVLAGLPDVPELRCIRDYLSERIEGILHPHSP